MAAREGFLGADVGFEGRGVEEAAEGVEDYGDAVVGEHGQCGDVVELAVGVWGEAGPDVCAC